MRPLTERQTVYAALDAWCLTSIVHALLKSHPHQVHACVAAMVFSGASLPAAAASNAGAETNSNNSSGEAPSLLGPDHVAAFLLRNGLDPALHIVSEISDDPTQHTKAITFLARDAPVVVVTLPREKVDPRCLAKHIGLNRRHIRLATPDECVRVFGYAPGVVCPVAHRDSRSLILLDRRLDQHSTVLCGAGSQTAFLKVPVKVRSMCVCVCACACGWAIGNVSHTELCSGLRRWRTPSGWRVSTTPSQSAAP
jgi:prolyl-tRNA editing enzyme YbaK/EbsC (Cys-tRNA(Pro) deacylase)